MGCRELVDAFEEVEAGKLVEGSGQGGVVFRDLLEIPRRYPHVDLALLHLGGTRVMGILVTMDAEQGIQAMQIGLPCFRACGRIDSIRTCVEAWCE